MSSKAFINQTALECFIFILDIYLYTFNSSKQNVVIIVGYGQDIFLLH
jgi:hypothetical protein